jgi:hypothetical protein
LPELKAQGRVDEPAVLEPRLVEKDGSPITSYGVIE